MKKAIIFLNGNLADISNIFDYVSAHDFIICANGGSRYAVVLDILPHVVIGDQDSLPDDIRCTFKKRTVSFIKHPCHKDQTDSELAISLAINRGFRNIFIFTFLGTRIDHMFANILLLSKKEYRNYNIKFIHGRQEIFLVKKKAKIKGKVNDQISLIPLTEKVKEITTSGLRFPLEKEDLILGTSRGVSNEFIENEAYITYRQGLLLAVYSRK